MDPAPLRSEACWTTGRLSSAIPNRGEPTRWSPLGSSSPSCSDSQMGRVAISFSGNWQAEHRVAQFMAYRWIALDGAGPGQSRAHGIALSSINALPQLGSNLLHMTRSKSHHVHGKGGAPTLQRGHQASLFKEFAGKDALAMQ